MGIVNWKESNYGCSLSSALYQLQQANVLCDIEIRTKTETVPVHRLVLHAITGNLCNDQAVESSAGCTVDNLIDTCCFFESAVVMTLIKYLYTGEVILDERYIERFCRLCKVLELEKVVAGVQKECNYMNTSLSPKRDTRASTNAPNLGTEIPSDRSFVNNHDNDALNDTEEQLSGLNSGLITEIKKEPLDTENSGICNQILTSATKTNNELGTKKIKRKGCATTSTSDNESNKLRKVISNVENYEDVDIKEEATSEDHESENNASISLRMCSICSKMFERDDDYFEHMKAEHELYTCLRCDWQDQRKERLVEHMASEHKGVSKTSYMYMTADETMEQSKKGKRIRSPSISAKEYEVLLEIMTKTTSIPVSKRTPLQTKMYKKVSKFGFRRMLVKDPYKGKNIPRICMDGKIVLPNEEVSKCIAKYCTWSKGDGARKIHNKINEHYYGIGEPIIQTFINTNDLQRRRRFTVEINGEKFDYVTIINKNL